jgi:hypothetical protein
MISYHADKDGSIGAHQDKAFSYRASTNLVEDATPITDLSLLCTREFWLVNLDALKLPASQNADASKLTPFLVQKYFMVHGSAIILEGYHNDCLAHAVPKASEEVTLRVSLVFRYVNRNFVDVGNNCVKRHKKDHFLREKDTKGTPVTFLLQPPLPASEYEPTTSPPAFEESAPAVGEMEVDESFYSESAAPSVVDEAINDGDVCMPDNTSEASEPDVPWKVREAAFTTFLEHTVAPKTDDVNIKNNLQYVRRKARAVEPSYPTVRFDGKLNFVLGKSTQGTQHFSGTVLFDVAVAFARATQAELNQLPPSQWPPRDTRFNVSHWLAEKSPLFFNAVSQLSGWVATASPSIQDKPVPDAGVDVSEYAKFCAEVVPWIADDGTLCVDAPVHVRQLLYSIDEVVPPATKRVARTALDAPADVFEDTSFEAVPQAVSGSKVSVPSEISDPNVSLASSSTGPVIYQVSNAPPASCCVDDEWKRTVFNNVMPLHGQYVHFKYTGQVRTVVGHELHMMDGSKINMKRMSEVKLEPPLLIPAGVWSAESFAALAHEKGSVKTETTSNAD